MARHDALLCSINERIGALPGTDGRQVGKTFGTDFPSLGTEWLSESLLDYEDDDERPAGQDTLEALLEDGDRY